jgi:hypothetical protein
MFEKLKSLFYFLLPLGQNPVAGPAWPPPYSLTRHAAEAQHRPTGQIPGLCDLVALKRHSSVLADLLRPAPRQPLQATCVRRAAW